MLTPIHTLTWYQVTFTFKMYLGEDVSNADEKVKSSLRHFPLLIHDFHITDKGLINTDDGVRMQLTMDLGLKPGVTIEYVQERFDCVSHLHHYVIEEIEEEA